MKLKTHFLFSFLGLVAAMTVTSSLQAQNPELKTFIWDPSLTTTGSNGSGTWDNTTPTWAQGGADVAFPANPVISVTTSAALASQTSQLTMSSTANLKVGQVLSTDKFPGGTYITAINGNVITLSASSGNNTLASGSAINFTSPYSVTFGAGSGTAGTVTVSGAQVVDNMTLNAPAGGGAYIFNGDAITVGPSNGSGLITVKNSATFNTALAWRNMRFEAAGQTITLNGGTPASNPVGSFNGGVTGSSSANAAASTLAITGGAYGAGGAGYTLSIGNITNRTGGVQFSGGTISAGGNWQIGTAAAGFMNHTGGTFNSSGQMTIGRNGNEGLYVLNGGTIASTSNNNTMFAISRGTKGTFEIQSGRFSLTTGGGTGGNQLDVNNANAGGIMVISMGENAATNGGTGVFTMTGGTAVIKEIRLGTVNNVLEGGVNAGSATVNIQGGNLYLGGNVAKATSTQSPALVREGGMRSFGAGTFTYQVNLSGGVIGANRSWSSDLNMTLSNTHGGVVFSALEEGSTTGHDITLSGVLSGSGTLTFDGGAGLLALTNTNTYSGGTNAINGNLNAMAAGSLGTGDVKIDNVTFTLGAANVIADTAKLYFTAVSEIHLAYAGNDVVSGIILTDSSASAASSGSASPQANLMSIGAGTYTADQLNAFFGLSGVYKFYGDGTLTVIPEPSSVSLLGLGLASVAFVRRRKSA